MQSQAIQQKISDKDWIIALVLAIVVGTVGIDRFYTGSTLLGVLKRLTLGGLGIWWTIDIILFVTGNYKDGDGLLIPTMEINNFQTAEFNLSNFLLKLGCLIPVKFPCLFLSSLIIEEKLVYVPTNIPANKGMDASIPVRSFLRFFPSVTEVLIVLKSESFMAKCSTSCTGSN